MVSLPTRDQFAFNRLFRQQPHRPTGATLQRTSAYHCNQALFLVGVEYLGCSRHLFFIQRPLQTALLITAADVSGCLRSQRNHAGNTRRSDVLGQLQKG
jgi:hypothetical protein